MEIDLGGNLWSGAAAGFGLQNTSSTRIYNVCCYKFNYKSPCSIFIGWSSYSSRTSSRSNPTSTLNLPTEPFTPNQIEVVVKLPKDTVKKGAILKDFSEKQLVSKLQQNLATKLVHLDDTTKKEHKIVKSLLEEMALRL